MSSVGHENGGAVKLDRDKLLRARELLGYGVEKTAEVAGVSKNSVLRAEHEEDIRPVTARKIAAALEVRVADLLGKEQAPGQSESAVDQMLRAPSIPLCEESDETIENLRENIRRKQAGERPVAFFQEDLEETAAQLAEEVLRLRKQLEGTKRTPA